MKRYTNTNISGLDRILGLGLMSGTSLDGLDMALCEFQFSDDRYKFEIIRAETIKYDVSWTEKLLTAKELPETELALLHHEYGNFLGDEVNRFLDGENNSIDFISSHGHTVKHDPDKGFTVQIGDGSCIANKSGILVVNDFRSANVEAGGQGAPLVPIGDLKLFSKYPLCLNLGGIANISIKKGNKIEAFDITSCNIGFNHFAKLKGLEFDESGKIGRSGEIHEALFKQLNALNYFKKSPPKSLDASFFYREMLPLIGRYHLDIPSASRTYYEHVAFQIASVIEDEHLELLITGGGTYNDFLIDLLNNKHRLKCTIPNQMLIDFKEALIFAFMGFLRLRGEVNCLASVTGSNKDQSTGIITYPKSS